MPLAVRPVCVEGGEGSGGVEGGGGGGWWWEGVVFVIVKRPALPCLSVASRAQKP